MKLTLENAEAMMRISGGSLDLSGTGITDTSKIHYLQDGDYVMGRYLYADGILTHIKGKKCVGPYTFFQGEIPGRNVLFDGTHYAHCKDFRTGKQGLDFKAAKDRGADQYRGLSLDEKVDTDTLITMYRVITGACQQGTQAFVESLGNTLKDGYTIQEAIAMTKGQYGAKTFEAFFAA